MPEATMAASMQQAVQTGYALAAFNVVTLEHAEGIIAGAERAGRPVILQISENAVGFHGGRVGPIAAAMHELAAAASVPVILHLDHIESQAVQDQAEAALITSIMIDNGRFPYDENVERTATAVDVLHGGQVFVEAELGWVGGKDSQVVSAHQPGVRTDPAQAAEYVAATGVDALAVAVGSSHAMTSQTATLDIDLIRALATAVPVPLVLHGSSGVPDEMLRAACAAGMSKINVGTALNIAFTGSLRSTLSAADGVDPRPHLAAARDAVATAVQHVLGTISTY